jgi:hypothetical protein
MVVLDQQDKVREDYPGFVVHNGRVSGSITLGPTRLPLWCLIQTMVDEGYASAEESWPCVSEYGSAEKIGYFLYDLLEQRRDFARLLCVLANVERREREARSRDPHQPAWYADSESVNRVRAALQDGLRELDYLASRKWFAEPEDSPEKDE